MPFAPPKKIILYILPLAGRYVNKKGDFDKKRQKDRKIL